MIKNIFSVSKKESTNYKGVVNVTANTGIKLTKSYELAEDNIRTILTNCFNVSPFSDYKKVIAAWHVYNNPNSWSASVKTTPEYEWIETLSKKNAPILLGLTGIYANGKTGTWWITYTIIDNNHLFYRV